MAVKETSKKITKALSEDIKDVAKELAMLDADPTMDLKEITSKVKSTAKTTAKKATATVKKVADTAKKATATSKNISKTAVVEFAGNQYMVTDIIGRCEDKFKSENSKKSYKDIKVYIKPENNAAYYVVDDKSAGMINLS